MDRSPASMPEYRPSPPQMSQRQRAVPPTLPVDHFKSARSAPHSILSGSSSGYLSPVTSDPWNGSPPPRPEAEDYIAVKARREHRKRHQSRHARRLHNTREDSHVFIPAQDSVPQSSGPRCGLCEAGSNESDADSVSKPPTRHKPGKTTSQSRLPTLRSGYDASEPTRSPTKAAFNETPALPKSPAIAALRRLSQPAQPNTVMKPGNARRVSDAVAAALDFLITPKTPSTGDQSPEYLTSRSPKERSCRDQHYRPGYREDKRRRSTFRDQLETPATITVRKASKARSFSIPPVLDSSMRISKQVETTGALQINPPSVELVAFYSEHRKNISPRAGTSPSDSSVEVSVNHGNRKSSVAQLGGYTKHRRQSAIADLAITFADVHIAPGTFAMNNKSREASWTSIDSPQRVSTVQFRSHNSVHEVIWREDETTSGSSISCSSRGSSSPDHNAQFQTIGDIGPESDGNPSQPSQATTEQGLHIPFLNPEQALNSPQHQAKLFHFSWDVPPTGPALDGIKYPEEPLKGGSGTQGSNQNAFQPKPENRPGSLGSAIESMSGGPPYVSSFPPFIDLNDPLAERAEANSSFVGRMVTSNAAMQNRRGSEHPHAPSRLREIGEAGSRLGVSSHQSKPLR